MNENPFRVWINVNEIRYLKKILSQKRCIVVGTMPIQKTNVNSFEYIGKFISTKSVEMCVLGVQRILTIHKLSISRKYSICSRWSMIAISYNLIEESGKEQAQTNRRINGMRRVQANRVSTVGVAGDQKTMPRTEFFLFISKLVRCILIDHSIDSLSIRILFNICLLFRVCVCVFFLAVTFNFICRLFGNIKSTFNTNREQPFDYSIYVYRWSGCIWHSHRIQNKLSQWNVALMLLFSVVVSLQRYIQIFFY